MMKPALFASTVLTMIFCMSSSYAATRPSSAAPQIRHVIIIMQENRSFDSYFGTFPGADGIPMRNGHPIYCVPDPARGTCIYPYRDTGYVDMGGPHSQRATAIDVDGGKMDGFIKAAEKVNWPNPDGVMGYHDYNEIPNYWTYAK